jgi:hypothetical protein
VEDYVDQWGLFVPDEDHAKWLLKKTARRANLFKHHHRVCKSALLLCNVVVLLTVIAQWIPPSEWMTQ